MNLIHKARSFHTVCCRYRMLVLVLSAALSGCTNTLLVEGDFPSPLVNKIPIKVGIVGAPIESNPTVALNLRILGVESATELAEVMAACGLAQNFAAIRALATEGIQRGHMSLHARSVAAAAGAARDEVERVASALSALGAFDVAAAARILKELRGP